MIIKQPLSGNDLNKVAGGTGGSVYYIDPDFCCCCGFCVDKCPVGAIVDDGITYRITGACNGCGACATNCPNGAIIG